MREFEKKNKQIEEGEFLIKIKKGENKKAKVGVTSLIKVFNQININKSYSSRLK